MNAQDNALLTAVGPGSAMGALMREYWISRLPRIRTGTRRRADAADAAGRSWSRSARPKARWG